VILDKQSIKKEQILRGFSDSSLRRERLVLRLLWGTFSAQFFFFLLFSFFRGDAICGAFRKWFCE
jgi:hypothetical protein